MSERKPFRKFRNTEPSLTIEQKRLLEDDRNTQTRMTEKKEVGIKNFEIIPQIDII